MFALVSLFSFNIFCTLFSPMSDFNCVCSSFASFKLISPSLILFIRSSALSDLLKSSSWVLPLYLNANL